jgi:cytoskeletal protein RodZ
MERIGERLRRRREELGFTVDDIARATKYRPEVIKAVEEGREAQPGPGRGPAGAEE